jgi:hypothetical protein
VTRRVLAHPSGSVRVEEKTTFDTLGQQLVDPFLAASGEFGHQPVGRRSHQNGVLGLFAQPAEILGAFHAPPTRPALSGPVAVERGDEVDHECSHQIPSAALCAEHVLHLFDEEQPRDTLPCDAIDVGRAWVRGDVRMGDARRAAFAANAAAHVAADDLGAAAYAIRAVGASASADETERHASGNESGSEKDSPRRFKNWSSMTSEVEARSAGTYSTTDIGPFVASHSDSDR